MFKLMAKKIITIYPKNVAYLDIREAIIHFADFLSLLLIISTNCFKDICGLFPHADFLHPETRKVGWVQSFDHLRFRLNAVFRNSYVRWIFPHFLDKIK